MARITPLIVYLSELTDDNNYKEFKSIISTEISLTHSSKLVHQATHLYAIAVKFLLNNFEMKPKHRANKAFDIVRKLSIDPEFAG